MKLLIQVEDFKKTETLPNWRLYKEDLLLFDNKIRNQMEQHGRIFELDDDEELTSFIKFEIRSSGQYKGFDWDRDENDLNVFFQSDVLKDGLSQGELSWNYYLGVREKGSQKKMTEQKSVIQRTITLMFSKDTSNIRIYGENIEWITDTIAIINNFFKIRGGIHERKFFISLMFTYYVLWLISFLVLFSLNLWTYNDESGDPFISAIIISMIILVLILINNDDFSKYHRRNCPYSELILREDPPREVPTKAYLIQFILSILSAVLVYLIIDKINKLI